MSRPVDLIRASDLPRHEAERLLVVASGLSRVELLAIPEVDGEAALRFEMLVVQRREGVPLQYLERTVQFGPLELLADHRALIPRPETEQLWERVVSLVGDGPADVIVDLCTGSGNLALSLKHEFPGASVYGTDISVAAVSLARHNSAITQVDVTWLQGDLFDPLPSDLRGRVDVIVANPPYIAADDFESLPREVREHEPFGALVSGPAGDEVLTRIAAQAGEWLRPGGLVACEIGEQQGGRALALFTDLDPFIEQDLTGRDRFVFCRRRFG